MSNVKSVIKKPTGPSGLRAGRLIEYKGEYGKVISLTTSVKAKISIGDKELMVNRSDLKFASAASKKANAAKPSGKETRKPVDLPIKKTAARARINKKKGVEKPKEIKAPVTEKKEPAKKSLQKESPKKIPKKSAAKKTSQPEIEGLKVVSTKKKAPVKKVLAKKTGPLTTSLKESYKILRPAYVALAFMNITSDRSYLENMIKGLERYGIKFAFANITEGTRIVDHKEFQKQNNIINKQNQQIKRAISDFADPEKSGISTPHLQNDMLVFNVSSALDHWLIKILEALRDKFSINNIDTMVTMSVEDDGPSDSIVQNVLIVGFA